MRFFTMSMILTTIFSSTFYCASYSDNRKLAFAMADKGAMAKNLPLIFDVNNLDIDSAGGVSLKVSIRNISSKQIKYFYITLTPYNAVGDRVVSEIGRQSLAKLAMTGPISSVRAVTSPGETIENGDGYFSSIWYNSTVACVKVESIEVIYMDNSRISVNSRKELSTMNKAYSDPIMAQPDLSSFDRNWLSSHVCQPK